MRLGKILKQWKEGVGGSACDDFEAAGVLQFAERLHDVTPQRFDEEFAGCGEKPNVKARQFGELSVVQVAFGFLLSQPDQSLKVPGVTLLEQLVAEHRAEGGGERHRQLESDVLVDQAPHQAKQWKIRFRDRLEKPVLLEKILVLRMPDKGQMSVKNEGERSGCHACHPEPRRR